MIKIMKLKIKNSELFSELMPALAELKSMPISGKIAVSVVHSYRAGNSVVADYEEARVSVLKSNCKKDENGKELTKIINNEKGEPILNGDGTVKQEFVFESDEVKTKVATEIKALLDSEVEFDIYPVSLSDIEKMSNITGDLLEPLVKHNFILEN